MRVEVIPTNWSDTCAQIKERGKVAVYQLRNDWMVAMRNVQDLPRTGRVLLKYLSEHGHGESRKGRTVKLYCLWDTGVTRICSPLQCHFSVSTCLSFSILLYPIRCQRRSFRSMMAM